MFEALSGPLLVCEAVLTETCFLLAGQPHAIAKIGDYLGRGLLVMIPVGAAAQPRIFALMEKYRQVPMSAGRFFPAGQKENRNTDLPPHGLTPRPRSLLCTPLFPQ